MQTKCRSGSDPRSRTNCCCSSSSSFTSVRREKETVREKIYFNARGGKFPKVSRRKRKERKKKEGCSMMICGSETHALAMVASSLVDCTRTSSSSLARPAAGFLLAVCIFLCCGTRTGVHQKRRIASRVFILYY